jgi:hypothetical protein
MPLTTNGVKIENDKLSLPFRIILSGSSGAGKTHFASQLLKNASLFEGNIEFIYYFHPCYLEEAPVDWHKTMAVPVSYQTGLPSLEQLTSMPKNSVIVLDDLMKKCNESDVIDQLFRVLSGKRHLSVMLMTQNYFGQGPFARNIRNSCNYSVLMRNCCDATINRRAVKAMGLTKAFNKAEEECKEKEYPYIFIDQSTKGQVTGYQVYTNIFDYYRKCFSNAGMPSYIIPEKDFLSVFTILQTKNRIVLAQEKNETKIQEKHTVIPISETNKDTSNTEETEGPESQRTNPYARKYRRSRRK